MLRTTRALPAVACRQLAQESTDPWSPPSGADALDLRRHDGAPPRLRTVVHLWRSESTLYVLYDMDDEREVTATLLRDDSEIWREDVVELFLAPRTPSEYYELEISPLATRFSAQISSPDLDRATMRVDMTWTPGSFTGLVRRDSGDPWRTRVRLSIDFEELDASPAPGDRWRINFYRIDRSDTGDEYSAWSTSDSDAPDFHRPRDFGIMEFA